MARIIAFAANLSEIVARTDARPGVRWAVPADRDGLTALGIGEPTLTVALESGARIVVVDEDGAILAYNAYLPVDEIKHFEWLVLRSKAQRDIVSIGGLVREDRRGRGLLGVMKGFAARQFRELGYERMISLVRAQNTASIRTQQRIGATPLVTFSRVRVGKLSLVWQGRTLRHASWGADNPFIATL